MKAQPSISESDKSELVLDFTESGGAGKTLR